MFFFLIFVCLIQCAKAFESTKQPFHTITIIDNNKTCVVRDDCENKGACIDGECFCTAYWTGKYCELTFQDVLGNSWAIYATTFTTAFTCIAILSMIQLVRSLLLQLDCAWNYWKVIHLLILFEGVCQMTDLGLSPGTSPSVPDWVRRCLTGLSVYIVMAIIIVVILFWCDVYMRVFATNAHPKIRMVQRVYRILLIVFFVVEMLCRFVYTLFDDGTIVFVLHSIFVALVCAMTAGAFLVVGRRMYNQIMKTAHSGVFRERLQKIQQLTVGASILLLLTFLSVVVLGIASFSSFGQHGIQNPNFYLLQQSIFRALQFIYCVFILFQLKVPPEVLSRAIERV